MSGGLTSGSVLLRSTAFTMGSRVLMAVSGVVAVPLLLHQLGTARFGILTLAWVVIGYAGVFDLGLGRALTKLTSERLGQGRDDEVPALFWTALTLLGGLGVVAAVAVAALTPTIVGDVLRIEDGLESEARGAFFLLAASIPFVLLSAALRGSLEARQRFDLTGATAVALSVLSYFGPVVLALVTPHLALAVSAVVLSRVLATAINLAMCLRVDPTLRGARTFDRSAAQTMLRFGGWLTATALIAPLLVTLDRFFLGAIVSATAVAYYATPYEAVRQLLIVAVSFSAVLFPAYSATIGTDRARAQRLFERGSTAIFTALFPLVLAVMAFAPEILDVWVGEELSRNSSEVMRWLVAGVLVNGLAFVAYSLLQSARPDLITKLLLCELVVYLPTFWLVVRAAGVEGAAIVAAGRVTVDAAIQHVVLVRLGLLTAAAVRGVAARVGAAAAGLVAVVLPASLELRALAFVLVLGVFLLVGWRRLLEDPERMLVRRATTRVVALVAHRPSTGTRS